MNDNDNRSVINYTNSSSLIY